ncbi:right-handed parallel beta-helix repeat-containing protein, partial [Methylobacterium sp. Leaf86]|uniref:right-handed parallel beta-helix repeat-containing protein n=2 Tax=unclassified Methylobacterium TaxID=2615210 RepID=UPI001910A964
MTRHDGTIVAKEGDVIRNLDIYVDSGPGIDIDNVNNVTVENVRIHINGNGGTEEGAGIRIMRGNNVDIQNVEVFNEGAPETGAERTPDHYGISAFEAEALSVTNATFHDTSTGVLVQYSPGATLEGIEGYDMRGPFPRGQLVQFGESPDSSLNNFYVHNDPKVAWTEDNISVYYSDNVTVSNGVIDGNNSPSGQ